MLRFHGLAKLYRTVFLFSLDGLFLVINPSLVNYVVEAMLPDLLKTDQQISLSERLNE